MSESNCCGTLSNELIQLIHQCVVDTSGWEEARNTFYTSQLLCKSWSRLAQISLYRDVCLPPDRIESFVKTLEKTTHLGDLVKNVKFYPDAQYINEKFHAKINQFIDTILRHTPHIERIGSSTSTAFEEILWDRLLQTKEPLVHLQKFTLLDNWDTALTGRYFKLSLKFKKTLTMLQLFPDPSADAVYSDFTTLKEHLKEFVSLKELQFCGALVESPIITEVDDLINNCPTTTHSLILDRCRFKNNHNYPKEIKVNNSIKELQLHSSALSACSLGYFAKKLPGLKTLTVTSAYHDFGKPETPEQYEEWWKQMMELCQPLQHYDISIDDLKYGGSVDQIRGCAALMARTFVHHKDNNSNEFIMYLGNSGFFKKNCNIEMKQGGSCVRLFDTINNKMFKQRAESFREIFKVIQSFSPQTIIVLDVNSREHLKKLADIHDDSTTPLSEARNSNVCPFAETLCTENWAIFNGVITLIKNKAASVVHLDKMIFFDPEEGCDNITQDVLSNSTSVSEFKFTNCLFGSNVLSKMSTTLPKIDRLVLQKCTFKSDSLYQLDIDLPETKLGHLELNLNQVACSGLFDMYASVEIVLRIGTVKTIIYREIGDKDLTEFSFSINCNDFGDESCSVNPTPKYCISINCKELQSLVFSAKKVIKSRFTEMI